MATSFLIMDPLGILLKSVATFKMTHTDFRDCRFSKHNHRCMCGVNLYKTNVHRGANSGSKRSERETGLFKDFVCRRGLPTSTHRSSFVQMNSDGARQYSPTTCALNFYHQVVRRPISCGFFPFYDYPFALTP